MEHFVHKNSIVREIWSKSDTILFIFAGSAAEFALNKAVDWLYFTGRLPAQPIDRLFSTVSYARRIIFAEKEEALKAIDQITAIHGAVEESRGAKIPDWAYRDVLFMLIDYSIRSFELLERVLSNEEKEDTYQVFHKLGKRMQIPDLPYDYADWCAMRDDHLSKHLAYSSFTADLYLQYKKHLGTIRFEVLKQAQFLLVPKNVSALLGIENNMWLTPMIPLYKFNRFMGLSPLVKNAILPKAYIQQIMDLDVND